MTGTRRIAGILLVLLLALGLTASGTAHEALHGHHVHHQGCQLCILGGTTPPPPPAPENPFRLLREGASFALPRPRERAPLFHLRTRAPPSLPLS